MLVERFGDLRGKLCYEGYYWCEKPCELCAVSQCIKNGCDETRELTTHEGKTYELQFMPFRDAGGVTMVMEVTRDITERKRMERERKELLSALGRRVKEFTTLHEVAQVATESLDMDQILNNSLDKVIQSMAVEMAAVLLADGQKGEVITVAHGEVSPEFLDKLKKLPIGKGIAGRETLSGVPIVIEDVLKYPQLADISVIREGLRSIAAVPLKSGGRVIGTLIIASHDLRSFSSEDISLLSTIGEGLGPALRNAQLYRELKEKTKQLDVQNRELAVRQEELLDKNRQVEEANRLKTEFLANMSHELRTPLNVIMGFSELMMDEVPGGVNEEQRQCLDDILSSGNHLLDLINEVLDLSKIESGKMELRITDFALTEVIKSLRSTMMPMLARRRQSLDVKVEKGLPKVRADKARVRQVLLNLLSNAAKFTPDGGRLKIEAVREGDWCQVSVVDNGIGIQQEDQGRIFEAFYRADNSITREAGGTGLGLTLSKQIIEVHGGRMWVQSEYGKGSQFTFTLPLATAN